jgi:hypothetical protein
MLQKLTNGYNLKPSENKTNLAARSCFTLASMQTGLPETLQRGDPTNCTLSKTTPSWKRDGPT